MQKVVPAILTADPAELREDLEKLKGQSSWVHIDIMDGKFVPNNSVNLFELGEAYEYFHLEIHLMVQNPEKYFEDCKAIGAKRVVFHAEASDSPAMVLKKMEEYAFQKAIALNPPTPVSQIAPYRERLDAVLLMSVNPGFQGQEFMKDALLKIPEIRKLSVRVLIGVDGGISEATVQQAFEAGVDYVAVGSAVMKAPDPAAGLKNLESLAAKYRGSKNPARGENF